MAGSALSIEPPMIAPLVSLCPQRAGAEQAPRSSRWRGTSACVAFHDLQRAPYHAELLRNVRALHVVLMVAMDRRAPSSMAHGGQPNELVRNDGSVGAMAATAAASTVAVASAGAARSQNENPGRGCDPGRGHVMLAGLLAQRTPVPSPFEPIPLPRRGTCTVAVALLDRLLDLRRGRGRGDGRRRRHRRDHGGPCRRRVRRLIRCGDVRRGRGSVVGRVHRRRLGGRGPLLPGLVRSDLGHRRRRSRAGRVRGRKRLPRRRARGVDRSGLAAGSGSKDEKRSSADALHDWTISLRTPETAARMPAGNRVFVSRSTTDGEASCPADPCMSRFSLP